MYFLKKGLSMPFYNNNHKGKKPWVGQIRLPQGKYRRKSFPTKKEAKVWEQEEKTRIQYLSEGISLAVICDKFLDYCEEHNTKNTYKERLKVIKIFFTFHGFNNQILIEDVLPIHINKFLQWLKTHQRKSTMFNHNGKPTKLSPLTAYKSLSPVWTFANEQMGLMNPSVVNMFTVIKKPEAKEGSIHLKPPLEDFWAIWKAASTQQDKNMLETYLYTAARKIELFRLKWCDVNWDRRTITLYTNKGGKRQYDDVEINDRLQDVLKNQFEITGENEYVFISKTTRTRYFHRNKFIYELCDKADVNRFGYHGIRKLNAEALIQQNAPLKNVQRQLRHRNLRTTEYYVNSVVMPKNNSSFLDKIERDD
ncbi:MAG: tyrosine-type recombinase/integrase [Desulfotalea sp.]